VQLQDAEAIRPLLAQMGERIGHIAGHVNLSVVQLSSRLQVSQVSISDMVSASAREQMRIKDSLRSTCQQV
jgi:hypothetical protein